MYREARSVGVFAMEVTLANRQGNNTDMYWKINYPVLEIHNGGGETANYCE